MDIDLIRAADSVDIAAKIIARKMQGTEHYLLACVVVKSGIRLSTNADSDAVKNEIARLIKDALSKPAIRNRGK